MPFLQRLPQLRLIFILLIFLVVALAVYARLDSSAQSGRSLVSVIVATKDIPLSAPLTAGAAGNVAVMDRPADSLGPAPVESLSLALAARANAPIYQGEVVQTTRLYPVSGSSASSGTASLLQRGYAEITLPTSALAMPLSGLRSGDHVAILASVKRSVPATVQGPNGVPVTGPDDTLATSPLVVTPIDQDALVVAVAANMRAVTVEVPKREVPVLRLLSPLAGTLTFALVQPRDDTGSMSNATTGSFSREYHVGR